MVISPAIVTIVMEHHREFVIICFAAFRADALCSVRVLLVIKLCSLREMDWNSGEEHQWSFGTNSSSPSFPELSCESSSSPSLPESILGNNDSSSTPLALPFRVCETLFIVTYFIRCYSCNEIGVSFRFKMTGLRSYGLKFEPLSCREITSGGLTHPVILPRLAKLIPAYW